MTRKQNSKEKAQPFGSPDRSIVFNSTIASSDTASVSGITTLPNPFTSDTNTAVAETKVLLRTEEEQQAAAREREAKESSEMEVYINKRREARRKSLANRRVSFAPEATLHTWDVVEYLQDSTTSSASTSSTRRASSTSTATVDSPRFHASGMPSLDPSEPPYTPPERIENPTVSSPTDQQAFHQKKRRRSSGIPLNFNNPDDELFSSSPSSGSSAVGDENDNQVLPTIDDEISDSNSNSDDEGTAMSLDVGDNTDMSAKSSASSDGSSARLDEALQFAARQAGTQGIKFDEHGEVGITEEEVVASFQPWSQKPTTQKPIFFNDQENLSPVSPAPKIAFPGKEKDDDSTSMQLTQAVGRIMPGRQSDDEMAMDMTVAVGRIMSPTAADSTCKGHKPDAVKQRQSIRRRSSAEVTSPGDDTMDLTIAIGGIKQSVGEVDDITEVESEDMTMELTSIIGGVMASNGSPAPKHKRSSMTRSNGLQNRRRQSIVSTVGDEAMDITVAIGGILPTVLSKTELDNSTIGMDMTMALGGILPEQPSTTNCKTRCAMEKEIGHSSPLPSSPATSQGKVHTNTVASETGSPSLAAFKGKGLRRSTGPRPSTTPKPTKAITKGTPTKKLSSPTKQINPKPSRPTISETISPRIIAQSTSPRKPFKDLSKSDSSTPEAKSSRSTPNRLFQRDITTNALIPSIILTPQKRQSSGLGIDRIGLGSPRIADLLDRRRSIGDMALTFTSGESLENNHGVVFDDPQLIEEELDKERREEKDREDGRKIMEREADTAETEKDVTVNLKEMIESLTPRKRPLNGRKSLHVGAAKGILGKRPAELDQDDEETDEDHDGVKRLKNHQGSPVKNVKLQAPPSKAETTGRITRAARRSLETTSGNAITPTTTASPLKVTTATTPKGQGRFRAADSQLSAQRVVPFVQRAPIEDPIVDEEEDEAERMHLQDFLNMTSIRFMELTTTKRRYTVAPSGTQKGIDLKHNSDEADQSFENCVVAGACTVPMLELFQHVSRVVQIPPSTHDVDMI
jgi:kinetochore protein Spc7/SPC105